MPTDKGEGLTMKGGNMTGIVLIAGAVVLLILASVLTFFDRKVDTSKQDEAIVRIETAVVNFTKAQETKVKELETVDQNLQAQIQAAFHKLNHLEGKLDAAQNFKGLVEAMANRPVKVVYPRREVKKPMLNKALLENPPTLKAPKLLRKKK